MSNKNRAKAGIVITAEGLKVAELRAGERLGTVLERRRLELDMDTEAVAGELPIRQYAYERIEWGLNNNPPDDIIEAIAEVLDLNADDLFDLRTKDQKDPVDPFYWYW